MREIINEALKPKKIQFQKKEETRQGNRIINNLSQYSRDARQAMAITFYQTYQRLIVIININKQ